MNTGSTTPRPREMHVAAAVLAAYVRDVASR
jgi:hypothetical protein